MFSDQVPEAKVSSFQQFLDLFDDDGVEDVVHTGGAKDAEVSLETVHFVFRDDQTAAVDLFQDVFLTDERFYRVVDLQGFEQVDETVVAFKQFHNLACSHGVAQEFRLAQYVCEAEVKRARVVRKGGKADVFGGTGYQFHGIVNLFFDFLDGVFALDLLEHGYGLLAGFLVVGHLIQKKPVAKVGRDAAGGRVGLVYQTFLFQLGHVVADGCRAYVEFVTDDDRLRSDRFGGGDEMFDDCL
jgi:hypothetical protein